MSFAGQDVSGVASPASKGAALRARLLERQRRRRHARTLSTLLLGLGIAFVGHQFLRPPEPSRMEQMADKLLPAAQATPSGQLPQRPQRATR